MNWLLPTSQAQSPRQHVRTSLLLSRRVLLAAPALLICPKALRAQDKQGPTLHLPLNDAARLASRNVSIVPTRFKGRECLEVRINGSYAGPDKDYFAYVPGLKMHDGTIEVEVAGEPMPGFPAGARGFVGVAFRIDEADGSFACEGLYIRPTNGRADDQVRRNHSTQYFSYPGYDFDRLRRETPSQYEAYVDIEPAQWTRLRVEISGSRALLFVGKATQPTLMVNDLKHGADASGTVGLYVDNGTDGHFTNLRITPR